MLKTLFDIPLKCTVAVSGGPDSMAVLDFLRRGKKYINVVHVNHCTPNSDMSEGAVREYCTGYDIPIDVHVLQDLDELRMIHHTSPEACWHIERARIFRSYDDHVVTAHNLDDACEWWLLTAFNGHPKLMPTKNDNIIRPFMLTQKSTLRQWCEQKGVPYVDDPSNGSLIHARNRVRHRIVPEVLNIQPGFRKIIYKKLVETNMGS